MKTLLFIFTILLSVASFAGKIQCEVSKARYVNYNQTYRHVLWKEVYSFNNMDKFPYLELEKDIKVKINSDIRIVSHLSIGHFNDSALTMSTTYYYKDYSFDYNEYFKLYSSPSSNNNIGLGEGSLKKHFNGGLDEIHYSLDCILRDF